MVDKETGELGRIMTDDAVFLKEIAGEQLDAKAGDLLRIETNLLGTFSAIAARDFGGDGLAIGDDIVNEVLADVILNGANVFAECVVSGFAGLGHEIGDVNAGSFRTSNSVGNFRYQEIRKNAGVQGSWAHEDQVSVADRLERGVERTDTSRNKLQSANRHRTAGDIGFAFDALAIDQCCDEMHVGGGGGKDPATNCEDFPGNPDCFGEIAGDMRKRGEKKVAKIVAAKAAPSLESILEETTEKSLIFGERHHAVAYIARGEDAVFATQAPGTAAVVGDRYNGREVCDGAGEGWILIAATHDVLLQTAEQRGETGAATKGDHCEGARGALRLSRLFHKIRVPLRIIDAERHLDETPAGWGSESTEI